MKQKESNNKKFIFILGAGVFSGKEIVTLNLMKELKTRGHDVFCITSNWCSKDFTKALEDAEIPYQKVRLGFISKQLTFSAIKMTLHQLIYLPKLWLDIVSIFKSFKPHIIIHNNFHHTFLLYPLLKKTSKQIYHIHESYNNSKFYNRLFNFLDRKIDTFVGVSNFVSHKLQVITGTNPIVIYNGLNTKTKITNLSKLDNNTINIGIIGQIGEWKGHEDLVLAVALLNKSERQNLKIHIFGNHLQNSFADYLKGLIIKNTLDDIFIWRGFIKDQNDIYENLNIVCVPSRYDEPLATTALEAGLFSIPVIATSQGGLPEIINDGINGILVSSNNPELLSDAIKSLINNKNLMSKMGNSHYKVITKKFKLSNMALSFEELLTKK